MSDAEICHAVRTVMMSAMRKEFTDGMTTEYLSTVTGYKVAEIDEALGTDDMFEEMPTQDAWRFTREHFVSLLGRSVWLSSQLFTQDE